MIADRIGLRTWLLAAAAMWALACGAAAWMGAGARLPTLQQHTEGAPLPASLAPVAAGLGALEDYRQIVERPLFADDRKLHAFVVEGGDVANTGTVRLTGVVLVPGLQLATLTKADGSSLRLRIGDEPVEGWQLLDLAPRSATLAGPDGTVRLELQSAGGDAGAQEPDAAQAGPVTAPSQEVAPAPQQLDAIRQRIQARRKQAQNASSTRQPVE